MKIKQKYAVKTATLMHLFESVSEITSCPKRIIKH